MSWDARRIYVTGETVSPIAMNRLTREVEQLEAKMMHSNETKSLRVFISYKWEDEVHNAWVEKFAFDLRYAGIEASLDKWEVRLGDSLSEYMASNIAEADVVLFIMTTQSVEAAEAPKGKGGAVKFEIQMATARRTDGENMRLIGIYREGNKTAAHLRDHKYADFRDDTLYESRLKELIDDLLGNTQAPPVRNPSSITPVRQQEEDGDRWVRTGTAYITDEFGTHEKPTYSRESAIRPDPP